MCVIPRAAVVKFEDMVAICFPDAPPVHIDCLSALERVGASDTYESVKNDGPAPIDLVPLTIGRGHFCWRCPLKFNAPQSIHRILLSNVACISGSLTERRAERIIRRCMRFQGDI